MTVSGLRGPAGSRQRLDIVTSAGTADRFAVAGPIGLRFDTLTHDRIEASVAGNAFFEHNRLIVQLDMAARSDELKAKISAAPEWDHVTWAAGRFSRSKSAWKLYTSKHHPRC